MPDKLIAVTRTSSKGSSLRMTLPKEIAEKLNVSESEHIGFYEVNKDSVYFYEKCSSGIFPNLFSFNILTDSSSS